MITLFKIKRIKSQIKYKDIRSKIIPNLRVKDST